MIPAARVTYHHTCTESAANSQFRSCLTHVAVVLARKVLAATISPRAARMPRSSRVVPLSARGRCSLAVMTSLQCSDFVHGNSIGVGGKVTQLGLGAGYLR